MDFEAPDEVEEVPSSGVFGGLPNPNPTGFPILPLLGLPKPNSDGRVGEPAPKENPDEDEVGFSAKAEG